MLHLMLLRDQQNDTVFRTEKYTCKISQYTLLVEKHSLTIIISDLTNFNDWIFELTSLVTFVMNGVETLLVTSWKFNKKYENWSKHIGYLLPLWYEAILMQL